MTREQIERLGVFEWIAYFFNLFVRFRWYGKIIISFENGKVTNLKEEINNKPPKGRNTEEIKHFNGFTIVNKSLYLEGGEENGEQDES